MNILIDSREQGERGLANTRKERAYNYYTKKGYTCNIKKLSTADYVFNNTVAYEYKSISDFMSSTFNRRLFDEVTNQSAAYQYSYLIIVGDLEDYMLDSWQQHRLRQKYKTFDRFIKNTIAAYTGSIRRVQTICPVIYSADEKGAFQEMLLQTQKCLNPRHYGSHTKRRNIETAVDVVLCSVKNISEKKAKTIKQTLHIKNLSDLMEQSIHNFNSVNGIGRKSAENIYNFIHSEEEIQK